MALDVSRSEKKRRIKMVEELVIELSDLPVGVIKNLPCSSEVQSALLDGNNLQGGARKRQLKYVVKILKEEPVDELYEFLAKRKGSALQENRQIHEVEFLRDSLLNESLEKNRQCKEMNLILAEDWDSEVVREIHARFPGIDSLNLKRLSSHFARTRNKRHSREIFRIIKASMDDASSGK